MTQNAVKCVPRADFVDVTSHVLNVTKNNQLGRAVNSLRAHRPLIDFFHAHTPPHILKDGAQYRAEFAQSIIQHPRFAVEGNRFSIEDPVEWLDAFPPPVPCRGLRDRTIYEIYGVWGVKDLDRAGRQYRAAHLSDADVSGSIGARCT